QRRAEESLTSARLLADRPAVLDLAADGGGELGSFLARFRKAGSLDACAVFARESLIAGDPPDFPWDRVAPWAGPGIRYLGLSDDPRAAPVILAGSHLTGDGEGTAIVVSLLDGERLRGLEGQVG